MSDARLFQAKEYGAVAHMLGLQDAGKCQL